MKPKTLPFALIAALGTLGGACAPVDSVTAASKNAGLSGDPACSGTACNATTGEDAVKELAFFKTYFTGVSVSSSGTTITLHSNGLPPHQSPYYNTSDPLWVAFDTRNGDRWQNPNRIAVQNHTLDLPVDPQSKGVVVTTALVDHMGGTSPQEYHGPGIGMCLDGVALFHGVAAPGDDIAQEEHTFDQYEGHPEKTGEYHHHGASPGPLEVLKKKGLITTTTPGQAEVELYGVMCDGTLVFGCTELDGSAPKSTDFDAQNGHVHAITDQTTTYFKARYHTHVCPGKFPNQPYTPEIQYYSACGSGSQTQPPPP